MDSKLEAILQNTVVQFIYKEAQQSGKPVFCVVDDTISSKTKLLSQALPPIKDAYFHQSHLKVKQDYGHQAVAVMLSCNGIVLNYAIVMYDKTKSKVKIVQEIANELPVPPVVSYFLCDSWYICGSIKQKVSEFALHLRETDPDVSLVTVGSRIYYVCRYEGSLNSIDNAVVLISYLKYAFHAPRPCGLLSAQMFL